MTVRITELGDGDTTVFRVAGRLREETVEELLRAVEKVGSAVALELSDLIAADEYGIMALRHLASLGAELRNMPPTIAILMGRPVGDTSSASDDQAN